ncbi:MAG TPA: hypothetical protein VLA99_05880 [Nitrospiraceae bacterium]|nr:hypothetical protein [Nitrospiraceae bacterium]
MTQEGPVVRGPIGKGSLCGLLFGLFCVCLLSSPADAEIRTLTAEGEHLLGGHDTKEDAVRLASEAAKRNALEQVALYLESVTVVTNFNVTKDEIRTYTAGVVNILDQQVSTRLDNNAVVFHVDVVAQVDTDEVADAIKKLRENEEARQQLVALKAEVDQLQQALDEANQALAAASTQDQVEEASRQRADLLNQVQSNALVHQAWTEWVIAGPYLWSSLSPWSGPGLVYGLLAQAGRLYPNSPYVPIAQQAVAAQSGIPVPPAPPTPPAPHAPPPPSGVIQPIPVVPSTVSPTVGGPIAPAPSASNRSLHRLQTTFPHLLSPMPMSPPSDPGAQVVAPTGKPDSPRQLRQYLIQPGIARPPSVVRPPVAGSPSVTPSLPPVVQQLPPSGQPVKPAAPSAHVPQAPSGASQAPPRSSGRGLSQLQRALPGVAPGSGAHPGGGKTGGSGGR